MKSLVLKNLNLFYGSFQAVRDVSLDVKRGEFLALLGSSGCGKTSLLRAVAGFVEPHSGDIRIGERNVIRVPPRSRNLGIVFQSYALFPHMTALENVSFGLTCRNLDKTTIRSRAEEALEMVGLSEFVDRKPRQLSGGQQQRVALARALVIQPDILLLDEPLGALDRKLRLQMQVELKALQERLGVTTVMVTHDQEEAMVLADRIAVMKGGVIEQIGPPDSLFSRPETSWVADFMGSGNVFECSVDLHSPVPRVRAGEHLAFELPAAGTAGQGDRITVFVRSDAIQLAPATANEGMEVRSKRFLGFNVEIVAMRDGLLLRAVLPLSEASGIEQGNWVVPKIESKDVHIVQ